MLQYLKSQGRLLCLFATTLPLMAHASPWINVGDLAARHHLEALQSEGCLAGVTTSWPISWAAVSKGYALARSRLSGKQAARCENAHIRYLKRELEQARQNSSQLFLTLAASNQEPLFRGYSTTPRDESEAQLSASTLGKHWAGQISVSYVDGERDTRHLRADDSYLAGLLGNWQLGVGAIDRWWGPGWQSSLVLSNNARPVPALWVSRQVPYAPQSPWLHWIGPWDLRVFAGQLEHNRYVPNAKLLGARFVFKPWSHLQIGLTRMAQWGGEGRPESLKSLGDVIIGKDNGASSGFGKGQDPSNQLGGVDFRLSIPTALPLGVYGQFIGEDQAGYVPSRYSALAGIDLVSNLGKGSQRYYIESTETRAGSWFAQHSFHTAYEHSRYRSGYRYYGRNLATTWEGDARVTTLGIQQFFDRGVTMSVNLSRAELNLGGGKSAVVVTDGAQILQAASPQSIDLAQLTLEHDLFGGRLSWMLNVTDKPVTTFQGKRERVTAGLRWMRNIGW